jgi:replicative DNA helicase
MKLSAPVYRLKHRAKQLARAEEIPLHEALDRVARAEGFAAWSLLAAQAARNPAAKTLLSLLADGDLLLLGARPGQGKTLLGLRLLLDAVDDGRQAHFFTLDYSAREAEARIASLAGGAANGRKLDVVTSDAISAAFIAERLAGTPRGTLAVVDYLQILDQQRSKPALAEQLGSLRAFARESGAVLGFISQIDRAFDPRAKAVPDIRDVRMPNPIDLGLFHKTCFLHDGEMRLS